MFKDFSLKTSRITSCCFGSIGASKSEESSSNFSDRRSILSFCCSVSSNSSSYWSEKLVYSEHSRCLIVSFWGTSTYENDSIKLRGFGYDLYFLSLSFFPFSLSFRLILILGVRLSEYSSMKGSQFGFLWSIFIFASKDIFSFQKRYLSRSALS